MKSRVIAQLCQYLTSYGMTVKLFLSFLIFPVLAVAQELDLPDAFKADPKRPDVKYSFSAKRMYYKEKDALQAKYRTRFAEALKHADSVEVFLLSFTPVAEVPEGEDQTYFPISPYKSFSKILQSKKLEGDAIVESKVLTVKMLKEQSGGDDAGCHFPIHGIRLFKDDESIFQTSICWRCSNFYIQYPDDFETASWVGINSPELKKFLTKEMPIPKAEVDRFEAKYGKD